MLPMSWDDEIDLADAERIEHARDIGRLGLLVVAAGRMRRQSHAAKIGNDDGEVRHQRLRERHPHVAGVAEAVNQDDGGTVPAQADMNRRTVGLDVLGGESGGKRPGVGGSLGGGRAHQRKACEYAARKKPTGRGPE
jgi:hypothetical protein